MKTYTGEMSAQVEGKDRTGITRKEMMGILDCFTVKDEGKEKTSRFLA